MKEVQKMVDRQRLKSAVNIQELKSQLADLGRRIELLRGYL
jgi:hypothetical protein